MIIVGQDKDIILNFENIDMIFVGNPLDTDNGKFQIIANAISNNELRLGCYKTEERAKEVLQEITNAIKCWEDFKGEIPHDTPNFKYEMPKE